MISHVSKISEQLALVDFKTGTASSTPLKSGGVKIGPKWMKMLALINLGDMAAEDITVSVVKASDAALTTPTVVKTPITTGQSYTLAGSASGNDNKNILIDIDESDIDKNDDTKPYYGIQVSTSDTVGGVVKIFTFAADEKFPPTLSANALNANYQDRDDDHSSVVMIKR